MSGNYMKGPWVWSYEYTDCGGKYIAIHNSENEYLVEEYGIGSEETANLFCVAPELLEALEKFADEFDNLPRSLGYEYTHMREARKLIAKAKGERSE